MSMLATVPGMTSVLPPADDADVPRYWRELGLPGLVDVHVHVLPDRVQAKVWQYFEAAGTHYGAEWPVAYALPVAGAARRPDRLGVRAFPTLPYPHKAGMAAWLNDWSAEFAAAPPAGAAVGDVLPRARGAALRRRGAATGVPASFKVHVQVGRLRPAAPAARPGVGPAGGDRHAGGHPLRLGAAGRGAHRAGADGRAAGAPPAAAAGDRPPRHAGVPGVPRPGRAVRAGAPGHDDVRHRLHRAAHALRPGRRCRGWPRCGTRCCSAATSRRSRTPTPTSCRRCTGWSWGRSGCAPSCGTTARGCSRSAA